MCTSMMASLTTITEAAERQRQAVEQREAFLHSQRPPANVVTPSAYFRDPRIWMNNNFEHTP